MPAGNQGRQRVLSGMRPTGPLHIGHYFGALRNWIELHNRQGEYDCFFFVADWHALTTDYADTSQVARNTIEIVTDWLAAGLDPSKCTMFLQSAVPEHAELHLLLSMVTPLGWLERVPSYKEQLENIKDRDLHTYGFLGYPVLQAADIVMYGDPDVELVVPVGEDQVSHVELSREIVRRFNFFYGFEVNPAITDEENGDLWEHVKANLSSVPEEKKPRAGLPLYDYLFISDAARKDAREIGLQNFLEKMGPAGRFFTCRNILREPGAMLTATPRIPGTDGRKMSKSYNNAIWLGEEPDAVRAKTMQMVTDPQRTHRSIPGRPEICPVFAYHKLFSDAETRARVDRDCRSAALGCVDDKKMMAETLVRWLEPIRARRKQYEAEPEKVLAILDEGSKRARKVAVETMRRAREAVFGWEKRHAELARQAHPGLPTRAPHTAGVRNVRAGK